MTANALKPSQRNCLLRDEALPLLRTADCSLGNREPCAQNTYNDQFDAIDSTWCKPCPSPGLSESPNASTSQAACKCIAGYYDVNDDPEKVECTACPVGSECKLSGNTLASLPLLPGFWRLSRDTTDIRECPDSSKNNESACIGGSGETCVEWTAGPYCRLCNATDSSRYYSVEDSQCLGCEGYSVRGALALALGVVLGLAAFALLLRWLKLNLGSKWLRMRRQLRQLQLLYGRLSLRAKLKQLYTFYQITTRIETIYSVSMPAEVRDLLNAIMPVFSLSIDSVGVPLQCLSLSSFTNKLLFMMLAPYVICLAILLGCVLRQHLMARRSAAGSHSHELAWRQGWLTALPAINLIFFLVFPAISNLGMSSKESNPRSVVWAEPSARSLVELTCRVPLCRSFPGL